LEGGDLQGSPFSFWGPTDFDSLGFVSVESIAMTEKQSALKALAAGNLVAAGELLRSYLSKQPGDAEALHLMGVVLRRQKLLPQAAAFLEKSIQADGTQPQVLNNLGITLAALGRQEDAAQAYLAAIRLAPGLADAHYNLGLLRSQQSLWTEAELALTKAAQLSPAQTGIFEALAIAQRAQGRFVEALAAATRATTLSPDRFSTHYGKGQVHMSLGEFDQAAQSYLRATELNPASDVCWIGLGHARRGSGHIAESKEAYRRAVECNPGNPDAHRLFNEMIWQAGEADQYLNSFKTTLVTRNGDHVLRHAFANELIKVQAFPAAAQEMNVVLKQQQTEETLDTMARIQAAMGDFDQALQFHRRAVAQATSATPFCNFSESLLKSGKFEEAHEVTRSALGRFPNDQGLLAFHTTALRLVGSPDYARIADIDRCTRVSDITPPGDYPDNAAFCAALRDFLEGLHRTKAHPTDQTLRGGTQTFGSLFLNPSPVLQSFVSRLRMNIQTFIDDMPDDPTHPFFRRRKAGFDFSGSWSVRLAKGGYHTNHYHSKGWISSAFYVDLPETINSSAEKQGWFKFGETNLQLGKDEVITRFVEPKVGSLVLFPSYFWHGTVPFESDVPRLTIAFDIIPT